MTFVNAWIVAARAVAHIGRAAPLLLLAACGGADLSLPEVSLPDVRVEAMRVPDIDLPRLGDARQWARPVAIGEVTVHVPPPDGFVEYCDQDPQMASRMRARLGEMTLLGCYRQTDGIVRGTLSSVARARPIDAAEFLRYKQALAARAALIQEAAASYADPQALERIATGDSEVLRVLRSGRNWVVHAVARQHTDGLQRGAAASVWVRERLLYLTLFAAPGASVDWDTLADIQVRWARATLEHTLWRRRD